MDVPVAIVSSMDAEDKLKLQIPTSVVDPVQMDYAFMEIFSGATKVSEGNFDSLMIPFFCVTADIESSKASIRRQGDLGLAIRASMLLAGGIAYTIGAVLFSLGQKIKWMHSIFHLFVIVGTLLQMVTVAFYL